MIGWHETSCVQLDNTTARFCAFDPKPFAFGLIADFHKGKLFLPFEQKKVVVRAFSGLPQAEAFNESLAELEKQKLARNVLKAFPEELGSSVRLVSKFPATVNRVSVPHKLLACKHAMEKGCPVLIQDRITNHAIQDLSRPWIKTKPADPQAIFPSSPLLSLAQKSLTLSHGNYVIIGTRGFVTSKVTRKGAATGVSEYFLTSLAVHSAGQSFGFSDEGPAGIARFLEDSGLKSADSLDDFRLPSNLLRLEPSAPVLEDVVESDTIGGREVEEKSAAANSENLDRRRNPGKERAVISSVNVPIEIRGPAQVNVLYSQPPPSYDSIVGSQEESHLENPPPYSFLPLRM